MSWPSSTGLSNECIEKYHELKAGKYRYLIFTLNDSQREIVVANTSVSNDYGTFLGDLPESKCRWAVYHFKYEKDGGTRSKTVFYTWSPDDAPIKEKMVFATSKDVIRRRLDGIAAEVQGTDYDEVSHEAVLDKVRRGR